MDLLPDDYGRTPHRPYYEEQRNDWSTRPKSQSRSAIIAKPICDHRNADLRSSFSFSLFRKRSLILILMAFAYPYPHPHDSPFCVILCLCCVSLAHCEPKLKIHRHSHKRHQIFDIHLYQTAHFSTKTYQNTYFFDTQMQQRQVARLSAPPAFLGVPISFHLNVHSISQCAFKTENGKSLD